MRRDSGGGGQKGWDKMRHYLAIQSDSCGFLSCDISPEGKRWLLARRRILPTHPAELNHQKTLSMASAGLQRPHAEASDCKPGPLSALI